MIVKIGLRIFIATGLLIMLYALGITPGCSPDVHFVGDGTVDPCTSFPKNSNCVQVVLNDEVEDKTGDTTPGGTTNGTTPRGGSPGGNLRTTRRGPTLPGNRPVKVETSYSTSLGKVDIMFVVDNSSSMAKEHKNIADQFEKFLDHIKDADYHIAVITTDLSQSPGPHPKNKPYQDGNFIPIGGHTYLTNPNRGSAPSAAIVNAFKTTIQRQETIDCDQTAKKAKEKASPEDQGTEWDALYESFFPASDDSTTTDGYPNCPSSDERGTYAMNLAIEKHQATGFFRDDAQLMFIVLSDEDVRSGKSSRNNQRYLASYEPEQYELEEKDEPEYLVRNIYHTFGRYKRFTVQSIIIPKGDENCKEEQKIYHRGPGAGNGEEGEQYQRLSEATESDLIHTGNLIPGNVMSICNRRYDKQLGQVSVQVDIPDLSLPCAKSQVESIKFFDVSEQNEYPAPKYKISGKTMTFEDSAEYKLFGGQLRIQVVCERYNEITSTYNIDIE